MIKWKKVRKKPVIAEAFQLTKETHQYLRKRKCRRLWSFDDEGCRLYTGLGSLKVNIDDWIIKDVNGKLYCYRPDIFEKTYDVLGTEEFMYNGISYLQHIHAKMKDLDFCLTNTTKPDELFQEIMECFPFLENKLLND